MGMKKNKSKGFLIVVSAPSGGGKTSVLFEVLKRYPQINFSVSATTRTPREGEKDGVNYHFISDEEFESSIKNDEFLEWNVVHGNKYGTLRNTVEEALNKGESIILDTDTVGAFNIRKHYPEAVLIFIVPSSPKLLIDRLKKRNTESQDLIKKRYAAAPGEIAHMPKYNYIIINDSLETAVSQFDEIIKAGNDADKFKSSNILPDLSEWREWISGKNYS